MRIFKHKSFHEWAKEEKLSDVVIKKAITEMENGLFEASLGSGLYKKRVAKDGQGKSDSYRTLVAFLVREKAFFVYGFSKNDRSNINEKEKKIYRQLAKYFLGMTESEIQKMLMNGKLYEVK
jgi:hypothetical protein